jgi:hypothetical protein
MREASSKLEFERAACSPHSEPFNSFDSRPFAKSPYRNGEYGWDWIRADLWELTQRSGNTFWLTT